MAVLLAEIFGAGDDRAVLLDQRRHDVVDRFEALGIARRIPGEEAENIVPGPRLRLGGGGQQILVAVGGDEVDLDVDLFLVGPLMAQLFERHIGAGHPVIPEADAQLPGGIGPAHKGRRQEGCRSAAVCSTVRRVVVICSSMPVIRSAKPLPRRWPVCAIVAANR